jgi:tRNA(Ile)-lysidine synthase
MAASKKCVPNFGLWGGLAPSLLTQPIEKLLTQVLPTGPLAVACSGGPDSAALAVSTAALCKTWQRPLYLFHVHHGMQRQADQWSKDVEHLGEILCATVFQANVKVDLTFGQGPEGSARSARQLALQDMAKQNGVAGVLLAHHAQDQAETVLLRLLRGSGVAGLAGMEKVAQPAQSTALWLRPWLDVAKPDILECLQAFSQATGWQAAQDPSNTDHRLGRGALRAQIIPALANRWPAWVKSVSRHAVQAAQASELLDEFADILLERIDFNHADFSFDLKIWRELTSPQQTLVLRRWLALAGVNMPTAARLDELIKQLRGLHALGQDRSLRWQQGFNVVECKNKRVILSTYQHPSAL